MAYRTLQEIFDGAVIPMLKQGNPSISLSGDCAYRAGGLKCAIGHLIPDDKYDPSFDQRGSTGIHRHENSDIREAAGIDPNDGHAKSLAIHLQNAHDTWFAGSDNSDFVASCREIAEQFDLGTAEMDAWLDANA